MTIVPEETRPTKEPTRGSGESAAEEGLPNDAGGTRIVTR